MYFGFIELSEHLLIHYRPLRGITCLVPKVLTDYEANMSKMEEVSITAQKVNGIEHT